jgi:hypothetical protein
LADAVLSHGRQPSRSKGVSFKVFCIQALAGTAPLGLFAKAALFSLNLPSSIELTAELNKVRQGALKTMTRRSSGLMGRTRTALEELKKLITGSSQSQDVIFIETY